MKTSLRWLVRLSAAWGFAGLAVNLAGGADEATTSARVEAAHAAMRRATAFLRSISADGGYLWNYSADLKRRAGESPADADHIWIQPPGTPAVGEAFLRAYTATGDAEFLAAARAVAEALGKCQLASGGWHYSADMKHPEKNRDGLLDYKGRAFAAANPDKPINPHYTIHTIYDDDNTQSVVRFLIAYEQATPGSNHPRDRAIHATLDRALEGMLRAQYPNGAWPQQFDGLPHGAADFPVKPSSFPKDSPATWPEDPGYTHFYTLNDSTQRDCIAVLLKAWRARHDARYLDAAKRGGDFLILAQLPEPQPAWAQQYNLKMEPAWARVFEPPGVVSHESGSALQSLVSLYAETGEVRFFRPIGPAVAWLERSKIGPSLWARLYEMGTNRPIYGDKDGKVHYDLNELTAERRTGYNWQNDYHLPAIIAECRELEKLGRDRLREAQQARSKKMQRQSSAKEIDAIIAGLDAQGRWVTNGKVDKRSAPEKIISTGVFSRNLETLSACVETFGPKPAERK